MNNNTRAAGNKGLILMFAYAQPIIGMTSGLLSTWHVGITTDSQVYIDNGIANQGVAFPINNIDGKDPNADPPSTATNIINRNVDQAGQYIHGLSGDFDVSLNSGDVTTKIGADGGAMTTVNGLINISPLPAHTGNIKIGIGGHAIPFKESEIASIIKDFIINKQVSQ
jgi:hypothetical protein